MKKLLLLSIFWSSKLMAQGDFPLGQQLMQYSIPVVVASDQSAIAVSTTGGAITATTVATLSYSSTNVTTSAWVQLIASTSTAIHNLCVFDSSGSIIKIGTGAAASEVARIYLPPGGAPYCYNVTIPAATRVSLEALDTDATTGRIIVTGLN